MVHERSAYLSACCSTVGLVGFQRWAGTVACPYSEATVFATKTTAIHETALWRMRVPMHVAWRACADDTLQAVSVEGLLTERQIRSGYTVGDIS